MRPHFTLFQSHIDLAHSYWKRQLIPDDTAVDATCGNGHDSKILASLVSTLYLFDIQNQAIQATKEALKDSKAELHFYEMCHSKMKDVIPQGTVKLIVYNLGYLPGSDKTIKTSPQTTLESVQSSLELVTPGGMISITCYPGHSEGAQEEKELVDFARSLCPKSWCVSFEQILNRNQAPSLLIFQKAKLF